MMGKQTTQQTWQCNGDGSAECTQTKTDCFYCDPSGFESLGTTIYDGNGEVVTRGGYSSEGKGGWDCTSKCWNNPDSSGMQTVINKQTRC